MTKMETRTGGGLVRRETHATTSWDGRRLRPVRPVSWVGEREQPVIKAHREARPGLACPVVEEGSLSFPSVGAVRARIAHLNSQETRPSGVGNMFRGFHGDATGYGFLAGFAHTFQHGVKGLGDLGPAETV